MFINYHFKMLTEFYSELDVFSIFWVFKFNNMGVPQYTVTEPAVASDKDSGVGLQSEHFQETADRLRKRMRNSVACCVMLFVLLIF